MGTTQPIRDKDELKNFIAYYEVAHPNIRNYTMIILGLYTALRISDVLNLKWKDVYYFEKDCFLDVTRRPEISVRPVFSSAQSTCSMSWRLMPPIALR